jgi:hypothetical protein
MTLFKTTKCHKPEDQISGKMKRNVAYFIINSNNNNGCCGGGDNNEYIENSLAEYLTKDVISFTIHIYPITITISYH